MIPPVRQRPSSSGRGLISGSPVLAKAAEEGSFSYWTPFRHPQLGEVELGGIDHLQTIRNPPPSLLKEECEKGFKVADAIRFSLPQLNVELEIRRLGIELYQVEALVENTGFLSTTSLYRTNPAVDDRVSADGNVDGLE